MLKRLASYQLEYEEMPFIVRRSKPKRKKVRKQPEEPNENVFKDE